MVFNSQEFLIFFTVVLLVYFNIKNLKIRQLFLLFASYFFYAWWNFYYIFLILASTLTDYFAALKIQNSDSRKERRFFLILSIAVNLGILFTFKYSNFLIRTLNFHTDYFSANPLPLLDVLLPVGISFYTFQTMGYTIDVYRRKIPAERNLLAFALYVSFFPQLVAGPIERAKNLLPQIKGKIHISAENVSKGLFLMVWGFFLKVVVADNLAVFVDYIFAHKHSYYGLSLAVGILFFAFQIYSDFAGYTNIARGIAFILGFNLMENFRQPYFATSVRNFWHRWHISLSTWFRDYVYIPLGGKKLTLPKWAMAVILTFTVSGLWHGAQWTFVIWGALFGIIYVLERLIAKTLKPATKKFLNTGFMIAFRRLAVFSLVLLMWIWFRAETFTESIVYFKHLFTPNFNFNFNRLMMLTNFLLIMFVLAVDIFQSDKPLEDKFLEQKPFVRFLWNYILLLAILFFGNWHIKEFIYFQF